MSLSIHCTPRFTLQLPSDLCMSLFSVVALQLLPTADSKGQYHCMHLPELQPRAQQAQSKRGRPRGNHAPLYVAVVSPASSMAAYPLGAPLHVRFTLQPPLCRRVWD